MRLRNALLAATVLAAPFAAIAPAHADPVDGIYIGAGAGGNYLEDTKVKGLAGFPVVTGYPGAVNGVVPSGQARFKSSWGGVGLVSIGYGFGNGLRAEIEGNYRQNSLRKISGTAFPTQAGGDNQTYGGMVNVLYDFDPALFGMGGGLPAPYLGVGVGYAETTLRGYKSFTNNGRAFRNFDNPEDGNLAYQGIAGLAIPVDGVPGLAITAEYRFFGTTSGQQFNYRQASLPGTGFANSSTVGKVKIDDQYNHSVLLGIRYNFNTPPVAVVTPPPPAGITRSYLVFFDWDRADLTGRARQIIAQAAQNSTRVSYTAVEVNGYTDSSGTAAYNQRLSIRRAQTVAAELVRDGVPRQAIAIQGFGETRQLVPTAQGVREPQNRRVEIIIR